MDRLTGLQVFDAVVRLGSFSKAARHLNISRAMASKYVSSLEDHLNSRLLIRTTRALNLTEAGHTYHKKVAHILSELEFADHAVAELQSEPVGTVKVMSSPSFGSFHLSRAIKTFKDQYPQICVELLLNNYFPDMIEEGVDIAIQLGKLKDSNLIARRLSSSRLIACASPDYFESNVIPLHPNDLVRHNCLNLYRHHREGHWSFCVNGKQEHIQVNGNLKSNMADCLRMAAINGCGLVQLPAFMIGDDIRAGSLIVVLQEFEPEPITISAIYPDREYLPARIKAFVEHLSAFFGSATAPKFGAL